MQHHEKLLRKFSQFLVFVDEVNITYSFEFYFHKITFCFSMSSLDLFRDSSNAGNIQDSPTHRSTSFAQLSSSQMALK